MSRKGVSPLPSPRKHSRQPHTHIHNQTHIHNKRHIDLQDIAIPAALACLPLPAEELFVYHPLRAERFLAFIPCVLNSFLLDVTNLAATPLTPPSPLNDSLQLILKQAANPLLRPVRTAACSCHASSQASSVTMGIQNKHVAAALHTPRELAARQAGRNQAGDCSRYLARTILLGPLPRSRSMGQAARRTAAKIPPSHCKCQIGRREWENTLGQRPAQIGWRVPKLAARQARQSQTGDCEQNLARTILQGSAASSRSSAQAARATAAESPPFHSTWEGGSGWLLYFAFFFTSLEGRRGYLESAGRQGPRQRQRAGVPCGHTTRSLSGLRLMTQLLMMRSTDSRARPAPSRSSM